MAKSSSNRVLRKKLGGMKRYSADVLFAMKIPTPLHIIHTKNGKDYIFEKKKNKYYRNGKEISESDYNKRNIGPL